MAILDDMKAMAKKQVQKWAEQDVKAAATPMERDLIALGIGPQPWRDAKTAELQSIYDQYAANKQAIESASNTEELKAAWKTAIQVRADAENWMRSLGAGAVVDLT